MSEFIIPNIQPAQKETLETGFYLVLLKATSTPPHIGLINDGKCFSLTVKGVEANIPWEKWHQLIHRKKIPVLCFQMNQSPSQQTLKQHFQPFTTVNPENTTCLEPIKNLFDELQVVAASRIFTVFDLLAPLFQQDQIKQIIHFFLDEHIHDGKFRMKRYTRAEIYKHISALEKQQ